jgi:large subunit ribosomal protein L29
MQLNKLKMNHAVSPLENPNKIKAYRRTVARLVTELHKRKLESAAANKANKQ